VAGEVEALLETMRLRREAEARLRQETDPRHVGPRSVSLRALAEAAAEWKGAERIAWHEVRGAAERGDPGPRVGGRAA